MTDKKELKSEEMEKVAGGRKYPTDEEIEEMKEKFEEYNKPRTITVTDDGVSSD